MEISSSLFVQGDQINKRTNGFMTQKSAHFANYFDQVTQRVNLILRVIQNHQRRREFLNKNEIYEIEILYDSQWINLIH